jgi:hypothetical protein
VCIKTDSFDLRYLTKPAYLKGLFMPDPDDKTVQVGKVSAASPLTFYDAHGKRTRHKTFLKSNRRFLLDWHMQGRTHHQTLLKSDRQF